MRTTKDNKIRLDRDERRIGNFIVKNEKEHIKLSDINQTFTHRVAKRTAIGMFLEQSFDALASDESTGKGLANYIAVLWAVSCAVPDVEFLETVFKASEDCIGRHPEAYGVTETDPTPERDDEIVREQRELKEFEEEVKQMPDD